MRYESSRPSNIFIITLFFQVRLLLQIERVSSASRLIITKFLFTFVKLLREVTMYSSTFFLRFVSEGIMKTRRFYDFCVVNVLNIVELLPSLKSQLF